MIVASIAGGALAPHKAIQRTRNARTPNGAATSISTERLYFFLVLAGDRNGVSFYAYDRICTTLEMTLDDYLAARKTLLEQDLVAFDGTRFQVLSLPAQPLSRDRPALVTDDDLERRDPATIRRIIRHSLGED